MKNFSASSDKSYGELKAIRLGIQSLVNVSKASPNQKIEVTEIESEQSKVEEPQKLLSDYHSNLPCYP